MRRQAAVTLKPFQSRHHPQFSHRVFWPNAEPGKPRHERRFKSEKEARRFKSVKELELLNGGRQVAALRDSSMNEAVWAIQILEPYGVSLRQVVQEFLSRQALSQRSVILSEAIHEFLKAKRQDGKSSRYLESLRSRLGRLAAHEVLVGDEVVCFEDRLVSDYETRELDVWLRGLRVASLTRNNYRRDLSAFFSWAESMGYCPVNPVQKTAQAEIVPEKVEIFNPSEFAVVLRRAPHDLIPYLALGGFAGLRPAEIDRLDWSHIHLGKDRIEVNGRVAKGAAHRYVPILAPLHAWLAPFQGLSGPVAPPGVNKRLLRFRKRLEVAPCNGDPSIAWKHDVLRHSFASYAQALYEDAGKVAAWCGHTTPATTYQHYHDRVERSDAEAWFAISPTLEPPPQRP